MNERMAAVLIWEHLEDSENNGKDEISIILADGRVITIQVKEVKRPVLTIIEND